MKIITLYECEICHEQYYFQERCEACEKSHEHAVKITSVNYAGEGAVYPSRITVRMSDGMELIYHRKT